ncbi:MAG: IPT/TIG domain-containing protein [Gemmatimonadaceae bacterium]|nr:IPT/TIG domain-containing protein [Gloeobacterales cyanobacterium ES-bin-141]
MEGGGWDAVSSTFLRDATGFVRYTVCEAASELGAEGNRILFVRTKDEKGTATTKEQQAKVVLSTSNGTGDLKFLPAGFYRTVLPVGYQLQNSLEGCGGKFETLGSEVSFKETRGANKFNLKLVKAQTQTPSFAVPSSSALPGTGSTEPPVPPNLDLPGSDSIAFIGQSSGIAGSTITLKDKPGTDRRSAVAVKFPGASGTGESPGLKIGKIDSLFSVDSSGLITASVPPEAVTGPLAVRFASGEWALTDTDFVVQRALAVKTLSPISGAPGTAITIVGSGFTQDTSVKFGEVSAFTVLSANGQELKVAVPAGLDPGKVTLTITDPSQPDSLKRFFDVLLLP